MPDKYFQFFDLIAGPSWQGSIITATQNVSYDGINYNPQTDHIMFASYYFLSEKMREHHRTHYNIIALLAEFGGLFTLISTVFSVIGTFINTRVHTAGMLEEMYYVKLKSSLGTKGMWPNLTKFTENLHQLNFSKMDTYYEVK